MINCLNSSINNHIAVFYKHKVLYPDKEEQQNGNDDDDEEDVNSVLRKI